MTAFTDVAIDCETLGTRWDAPILSIGAVAFDRKTGKLGQEFYQEIDFASACKSGRVDGNTVAWWMSQNSQARQIFHSQNSKFALATALQSFTSWGRALPGQIQPWGNGIMADIAWLEHAYDVGTVGLREPWHFRNVRDMRTIVDIYWHVRKTDPWKQVDTSGVAHNALDDARNQARVIAHCFMALALGAQPEPEEDEF